MKESDLSRIRVFVIESPNAIDLLKGRGEVPTLTTVGRLLGHEVASLVVYSKRQFEEALKYISSIDNNPKVQRNIVTKRAKRFDAPLCVHISAHGNSDGIAIGADDVSWQELAMAVSPVCREMHQYWGKIVFVLSACGAGCQQFSHELAVLEKQEGLQDIPAYIFVTADKVISWQNAAVAWAVFYNQLRGASLDNKKSIQDVIRRVKDACDVTLRYHRWDAEKQKYRTWEYAPAKD